MLLGHGSGLISGYNTTPEEEKAKYDAKKLCRVMGMGMTVIAILIFIMVLFENSLPAYFAYIAAGLILVDVVAIIILSSIICRK